MYPFAQLERKLYDAHGPCINLNRVKHGKMGFPFRCVARAHKEIAIAFWGIRATGYETRFANRNARARLPYRGNSRLNIDVSDCIESGGRVSSSISVIVGFRDVPIITPCQFAINLAKYNRIVQIIGRRLGIDFEPCQFPFELMRWLPFIKLRMHIWKAVQGIRVANIGIQVDAPVVSIKAVGEVAPMVVFKAVEVPNILGFRVSAW
jgi:hypothetical protein